MPINNKQFTEQAVLTSQEELDTSKFFTKLALFSSDGSTAIDPDLVGKALPVAAHQANSVAADVATLVADFNSLLAKLQAVGLMASA